MTTSGSTDFSVTTNEIIRDALMLLGAVDPGDGPTAEEVTDARRMLNMLSKYLQTMVTLWPKKEISHTLIPGTESYTVGVGADIDTPRPLRLLGVRRESLDGLEVAISIVSRDEYKKLPTKDTQSPPNLVYYDPQLSPGVLYVWPTGNSDNNILNLTFQRPLEDFDAPDNTPDYPQEWYLLLVYQLAVKLAPMYLKQIPQGLKIEAEQQLRRLQSWDTENTSIRINPKVKRR